MSDAAPVTALFLNCNARFGTAPAFVVNPELRGSRTASSRRTPHLPAPPWRWAIYLA